VKRFFEVTAPWVLALVVPIASPACKRSRASTGSEPQQAPVVKDESEGLLLTWIDDKGEFHLETRVADVPMMGRDAVRVVDPNKEDLTQLDRLFVVDLRQARSDGTYAVRTMSRPDFESIAVARREKAGPTLANAAPTGTSGPAPESPAGSPEPAKPSVRAPVIVYGAEWCGACHQAMRYLRSKGIPYVEKDVEKDPSAAREMQQKLAKNGLHSGSIPIIDVRGKVMIGFNPAEIDAALGDAL
jgi:glutaredoxin